MSVPSPKLEDPRRRKADQNNRQCGEERNADRPQDGAHRGPGNIENIAGQKREIVGLSFVDPVKVQHNLSLAAGTQDRPEDANLITTRGGGEPSRLRQHLRDRYGWLLTQSDGRRLQHFSASVDGLRGLRADDIIGPEDDILGRIYILRQTVQADLDGADFPLRI